MQQLCEQQACEDDEVQTGQHRRTCWERTGHGGRPCGSMHQWAPVRTLQRRPLADLSQRIPSLSGVFGQQHEMGRDVGPFFAADIRGEGVRECQALALPTTHQRHVFNGCTWPKGHH